MSARRDIVVVGGGVIGLMCAWRVAQAGAGVTLVERDRIGGGASGAALGLLMPLGATHRGPFPTLQRASLRMFPALADELRAKTGVDIEYDRSGRIELIHTARRREIAQREVQAAAADWPAPDGQPPQQLLTPAETSALAPLAMVGEHGALLCRATAQVNVALLLAALRAAAERDGVRICERTAVEALRTRGSRVGGVRTASGVLEADAVLVAAGAWTPRIDPALAHHAPITAEKGEAISFDATPRGPDPAAEMSQPSCAGAVGPGGGGAARPPVLRSQPLYLIAQRGGGWLAGATSEPAPDFEAAPTPEGVAQIATGVVRFVPALAGAPVGRTWAGLRPKPVGSRPFIGRVPCVDGLWVAAGHHKLGIGLAPATAEIIRDLMLHGHTDIPWASCDPAQRRQGATRST